MARAATLIGIRSRSRAFFSSLFASLFFSLLARARASPCVNVYKKRGLAAARDSTAAALVTVLPAGVAAKHRACSSIAARLLAGRVVENSQVFLLLLERVNSIGAYVDGPRRHSRWSL